MALTEEQQEIIDDPLDTDLIMVIAFSGAAKTTTMKAGTHQKKRGLDLAYNRPAAAAAQVIFPANTVCETVHALAYRTAHHAESRRGYADRRSSDRTAHMHTCAEPLLRYSPQAATAVRLRYTLAFVGGIDGYNFLYQMRDPLVRQFRSFAEMAHYAEATEDPETNRLVNVVSLYGDDISGLIPRLAALSDGARTDRRLDAGHGSQIERPGPLSRVVMANDSRFRRRRSGPAEGQSGLRRGHARGPFASAKQHVSRVASAHIVEAICPCGRQLLSAEWPTTSIQIEQLKARWRARRFDKRPGACIPQGLSIRQP